MISNGINKKLLLLGIAIGEQLDSSVSALAMLDNMPNSFPYEELNPRLALNEQIVTPTKAYLKQDFSINYNGDRVQVSNPSWTLSLKD